MKTRFEWIVEAGVEELAGVIFEFRFDAYGKATGNESVLPDTMKKIEEWLRQPKECNRGDEACE